MCIKSSIIGEVCEDNRHIRIMGIAKRMLKFMSIQARNQTILEGGSKSDMVAQMK